jgi:hypothetical protein
MRLLDTITITLAGLMVGNELAVSAFFNPAVWKLASTPQAQGLLYSRRFSGSGDACLVWIVSGTFGAGVVPASPSGCFAPSTHCNSDLGGHHHFYN